MKETAKRRIYGLLFVISLLALLPIGNDEFLFNSIIPSSNFISNSGSSILHINNIVTVILVIILIVLFFRIRLLLKNSHSQMQAITGIVILCVLLYRPVESKIISLRDGFNTIEILQDESELRYSIDVVGNFKVEGEIVLKNNSFDTLNFSAVLKNSNFVFLNNYDQVPDICLNVNNDGLIMILPNETKLYKLTYSSKINASADHSERGVLNRIAVLKIKDNIGRERNIGCDI